MEKEWKWEEINKVFRKEYEYDIGKFRGIGQMNWDWNL